MNVGRAAAPHPAWAPESTEPGAAPRVLLVTRPLSSNSTGRAYCLWLLGRRLGFVTRVVAVERSSMWLPLRGTEFERDSLSGVETDELEHLAAGADLIVSVKPLPEAYDPACRISARLGKPLLLDVDDPDLEVRLERASVKYRVRRAVVAPRYEVALRRCYRHAKRARHVTVSNPWLQERYGGTVIPHARASVPEGAAHTRDKPTVAFVGTPNWFKGFESVRRAVADLAPEGFSLVVTAPEPSDSRPWERWIGQTSLDEGLRVAAEADIVALPSLSHDYGVGQLPVKLIDAMLLGRAIVVSDIEPLRWATSPDAALRVPAGDGDALIAALKRLRAPELRERLGARARARALQLFTVEAVAVRWRQAVASALAAQVR